MAHEGLTQTPTAKTQAGKDSDFNYEVGTGGIVGLGQDAILGANPDVGSAGFEDLWDVGGDLVYPTAGEQWELVSASAQDAAAGTGVKTVIVQYLDDQYVEQVEIVTLTGTSAVNMVATDAFRFIRATCAELGSGAAARATNAGNIEIRVTSGGLSRGRIIAGNGNTMDGHYTVPAGKTAALTFVYANINKNQDAEAILTHRTAADSAFFQRFTISVYQDSIVGPIPIPTIFGEKSDLVVIAKSSNTDAKVTVALQFYVEDNA